MVVEIMQRDTAVTGIGYIILRDCPEDRLGEALGKGMERLKKAGAKTVLATSLPEGEPLHNGPVGVWRLTHVHDIVRLECPLPTPKPELKLTTRPVKRSADEKLYLELVNRAYAGVPYARTQTQNNLRQPNHRYALAYQGEQPVGGYQLDLSEKIPQLVTLAVVPELRRQGLGRALLRTALEGLNKAPVCALELSTANAAGLGLCQSEGFAQTALVSDWFEVV